MDPFTAVTGAAGLVSLGITICDGLLTYCRNYRARSDDLLVLSQHAERLRIFLRLLDDREQGSATKSDLKSYISECLGACDLCLQEFSAFNDKHSQQAPFPSLKSQGKSVVRRLQYPFQRDMFEFFKQQMHEFQFALSTQVLLMNYDLTTDLRREAVSESNKLASAIAAQGLIISDQVSGVLPVMKQNVDLRITQLEESLQNRLIGLEKLIKSSFQSHQRVEPVECAELKPLDSSQAEFGATAIPQNPNEQGQAPKIPAPCFLGDNPALSEGAITSSQGSLLEFECRCLADNTGTHNKSCVYSFREQKRCTLVGKIKIFNYIFRYKIQVQYSPHAFPGDFEIYPNFTVSATRDRSPAFELLDSTAAEQFGHTSMAADTMRREFKSSLIRIRQFFMDRKAWPTDVNRRGWNLVHMACFKYAMQLTDETAIIFVQFLRGLIEMGVPLNNDPAELFLHGAELRHAYASPLSGLVELYYLPLHRRRLLGMPCPSEYGLLSHAVLQESESDVRRILRTSRLAILEKAPGGETPLHLSASWSRGVDLLLELGGDTTRGIVDAKDSHGTIPIAYALQLRQTKSVQLLLDAGSRIDLEDTQNIEVVDRIGPQEAQSDEIIYLLSQHLANRRAELTSFALEWLSEYETFQFDLQGRKLLQEDASEIVEILQNLLIPIPWPFQRVQPGSIYHSQEMSATLAETLFQAGFNHTNVAFHGFTPLMTFSIQGLETRRKLKGTLDLVAWFVDHGADLNCSIPWAACRTWVPPKWETRRYEVIHRIADETGFSLQFSQISIYDELHLAQLCRILGDSTRDPCNCYCAPQGCSPSSLFARSMWLNVASVPIPKNAIRNKQYRRLRSSVEIIQLVVSSGKVLAGVVNEVIRLSTFTRLGMKHTCCTYMEWDRTDDKSVTEAIRDGEYELIEIMDPDDIAEIQEEDRHLALHLDALVEEFNTRFIELGQPFSEFFWGYWWNRMIEVDSEKDELSREDMSAIQEAGVVLED
ncbi:hypothetical protein AK830_g8078 [Neonectria ditissima]|uniref:Uncharacterized protein n=1 Tax=Neonectria ditissima TaxID=78410 RepID=A0A0P7BC81_9HYPO|nr:hypothetical protein AK830_g8078 [Neonectria ditissima]